MDAAFDFVAAALPQILQRDVDDAARVDHIIGGIDDAAIVDALSVGRRRQLVVRAARDDHSRRAAEQQHEQDCK